MRHIRYILIGIFFGIIMYKSQVVSWYRIYEMFTFGSFHMYGIIGTAVILGMIIVQTIKKREMKALNGEKIKFSPKNKSVSRYLMGGVIFGLGWALAGACPGPMYVLIGSGVYTIFIVVASAILGTFVYGVIKNKLPH